MNYKKIAIAIIVLFTLNGCVQSTALLGPIYTFSTTGSITQAGLSYSSDMAITSLTGKNTGENLKKLFSPKKEISEFQKLVKKRVEITRKKINLIKSQTENPKF
tara:strand:- start:441 stop:752 length:312 start_codon:yes stop_codon:yes gene_type:complete